MGMVIIKGNLRFSSHQMPIAFKVEGKRFDEGFRADLLIGNMVILELKSIEKLNNDYKKLLLTYLKLTDIKLGYILNFSGELMKDEIVRTINGDIS